MRKAAVLTEEQKAEKKEKMNRYMREYREQNRERLLEYSRKHNKERYHNDAEYRANQLARAKERYHMKASTDEAIAKQVERYIQKIMNLGYTVTVEKA